MALLAFLGQDLCGEDVIRQGVPINEARLCACPGCEAPAHRNGRIVLQGHGCRTRLTVLPPSRGEQTARLVKARCRRFRCTDCKGTCTVPPPGVLLNFLYSLYAIACAWLEALHKPLGDALPELEVYAHQGVDRLTPSRHRSGRPRWNSLRRWARRLPTWWPSRPLVGVTWRERVRCLVTGFLCEEGGDDRSALVARLVASHVRHGGEF